MVNGKPLVYLDNAATTQKPRSVIQSLVDYYENYNANVHRGVHTLSMEATDMTEAARKKVADFINAEEPETVIWTRNATEGMNIVAHSWARAHIEPGDEIVTTPMEHHSNLVPWQEIAAERGAVLRFIPLADDGTLDLSDVDDIITERTKLLVFTHASNSLGTINPAKLLTEKAQAVGATVLVDGAQSVPHMPVDVQDIGCDFLSFSGHKMMGPTGIGALYGKRELLEEMEPFLTGGEMVLQVTYEKASWAGLPWKFEAGTPNIADSIGLGAAVDYLTALGMENVREHEKQITTYALGALQGDRRGGRLWPAGPGTTWRRRLVPQRGRASARSRDIPRPAGHSGADGAPLHDAADGQAGGACNGSGVLLRLQHRAGSGPAG